MSHCKWTSERSPEIVCMSACVRAWACECERVCMCLQVHKPVCACVANYVHVYVCLCVHTHRSPELT